MKVIQNMLLGLSEVKGEGKKEGKEGNKKNKEEEKEKKFTRRGKEGLPVIPCHANMQRIVFWKCKTDQC